jgi:hypothetical protein
VPVFEKGAIVIETESKCTDAVAVVNAEKVVSLVETASGVLVARSLLALQTPAHKHPAPTIRAGIREDAEQLLALRRILSAGVQTEPRIQSRVQKPGVAQRDDIELEFEDLTAAGPV